MFGKFKVAHLLGSCKNTEDRFKYATKVLTRMGIICLTPVFHKYEEYLECGHMVDEMCTAKLRECDFCVLVTPEHIGESTRVKLIQAAELKKPVYIMINETLVPFNYDVYVSNTVIAHKV